MDTLLYSCCGLDVHRDMIEACIIKGIGSSPEIIRQQFQTTRKELQELGTWLSTNDCYTVAMESTGVYWKPVFQMLESIPGCVADIWVVNAHNMRNVPGRKSDVADAEWIASLLRHGLLEKSFVPPTDIQNLREYSRLHRTFVQERCRYVNRLEKFLQAHGFKFSSVMKDILSVTGKTLLNILAEIGEITPEDVSVNCRRLRKSDEEIAAAICGKINKAEQGLLKHLLRKLSSAQEDIDSILSDMQELVQPFALQMEIVCSIPGIDITSAVSILAEISANPQDNFSSPEKLCSWAGLSPRNDESAGKVKSRKIMHGNSYIKSILCQVAWATVRTRNSCFHDWFWSHQGKIGQKKAIIAVARKILKLIYVLLFRREKYTFPVPKNGPVNSPLCLT